MSTENENCLWDTDGILLGHEKVYSESGVVLDDDYYIKPYCPEPMPKNNDDEDGTVKKEEVRVAYADEQDNTSMLMDYVRSNFSQERRQFQWKKLKEASFEALSGIPLAAEVPDDFYEKPTFLINQITEKALTSFVLEALKICQSILSSNVVEDESDVNNLLALAMVLRCKPQVLKNALPTVYQQDINIIPLAWVLSQACLRNGDLGTQMKFEKEDAEEDGILNPWFEKPLDDMSLEELLGILHAVEGLHRYLNFMFWKELGHREPAPRIKALAGS